jgi:hypothetical protein
MNDVMLNDLSTILFMVLYAMMGVAMAAVLLSTLIDAYYAHIMDVAAQRLAASPDYLQSRMEFETLVTKLSEQMCLEFEAASKDNPFLRGLTAFLQKDHPRFKKRIKNMVREEKTGALVSGAAELLMGRNGA